MKKFQVINTILLAPGGGKEIHIKHKKNALLLYPYRSIRGMTMHNTLYLFSKIPIYLKENNLKLSSVLITNFDIVMAVGYDPIVLYKTLNKVIGTELIFK